MRRNAVISSAALSLILGIAFPAWTQQDQQKEKQDKHEQGQEANKQARPPQEHAQQPQKP